MGRKSKKKLPDLAKMELTAEEQELAKKKAIYLITLCILWPLTLLILWPTFRNIVPNIVYMSVVVISAINVILTFYYFKIDLSQDKYRAYLQQNKNLGKIWKFSSVFLISEVAIILIFIAMY